MLRVVEGVSEVAVPVESLDKVGLVTKSQIATRLLYQLSSFRATEECGYFLAVTELRSIGRGSPDELTKSVYFPVNFCCRTFIPKKGEVMVGTVYSVQDRGVFLNCGPMRFIYLSQLKMPNYSFVDGVNPFFLSNDLSRIEKDCAIRFMVVAVRWKNMAREFHILATIEDASLGPIQLAGSDAMDLQNLSA
ncbi:hypothetical protein ACH5RR_033095 [Cinchona calisaya]|uniref:DNA-directed RNA polymerase subunit n=1 Tax=Cinchona calisaya TaxID=153742 RepID=A0ABD2YL58_9GENT